MGAWDDYYRMKSPHLLGFSFITIVKPFILSAFYYKVKNCQHFQMFLSPLYILLGVPLFSHTMQTNGSNRNECCLPEELDLNEVIIANVT